MFLTGKHAVRVIANVTCYNGGVIIIMMRLRFFARVIRIRFVNISSINNLNCITPTPSEAVEVVVALESSEVGEVSFPPTHSNAVYGVFIF